MGLISAGQELANVGFAEMLTDGGLKVTLTYEKYTGEGDFSTPDGYPSDSFADSQSVDAMQATYTEEAAAASGNSKIEAGDIAYIFKKTALDDPEISPKDKWHRGTKKLSVKAVTRIWGFIMLSCAGEGSV